MALQPGTRLGPYEIEEAVGAGGMGEVYRAKDTRLGRTVAVKVLPEHRAADEEARARLEREARSVSSLSHPNICALYDLGHENGVDYLVMEYLEGETLCARLESGPIPTDDALRIALQIIDALTTAHRQGFVHRDLKPGNVMLTKSGAKLLDFGLAKALDSGAAPAGSLTAAATATTPLTATGTIMGTFQYMAPEQLEGNEADARSDLFAFGAVLYEMLTGRKPFTGGSQASLIAAILKEDPRPVTALAPSASPALDRLVERCLAKDPDERWHSASDLGHELRAILDGTSVAAAPVPASTKPGGAAGRERLAWTVTAVLAVVAAVLGWLAFRSSPVPDRTALAFEVHAPEGDYLRLTGAFAAPVAVSPDGQKMVFGTVERNEGNRLWVRSLESTEARPLPGTESGKRPFWSPDSRSVGFFGEGQLMKIELAGGTPLPVCPAPDARGGTWSPGGVIVFSPTSGSGLLRVAAEGGTPVPVTELNAEAGHASHRYPSFLPDGKTFVYLVIGGMGAAGTGAEAENEVWAASLAGDEPRLILRGAANAQFANGELFFFRGGALMARPFDPDRLEFTGEVRAAVPQVQYDAQYERGIFSESPTLLAYRAGAFRGRTTLRWYQPNGVEEGALGPSGSHTSPEISPDGRRLALVVQEEGSSDVWIYDVVGGSRTRLTFESGTSIWPRWSPDGRRIAYAQARPTGWSLAVASAVGEGTPQIVIEDPEVPGIPTDWTADGRRIVITQRQESTTRVGAIDAQPGAEVEWLFEIPGNEIQWARLSPDDRWYAYSSNRTGRWEVYVTPFPSAQGTWQISTNGGLEPVWSVDGKALYYRAGGKMTVRADIEVRDGVLNVARVTPLFDVLSNWAGTTGTTYDVAPDGRLLISTIAEAEARTPLTAVLDWK